MRFPPSLLDEIRTRLPLSEVVGRRVSWDRRKTQPGKGDFWACCPFHQEKSPSFHVDDRRNRYKCFGCGASGDHFKFLSETEGLNFPEAVERLAEQAGVALPKPDPQAAKREERRAGLAEICEMAAQFFQAEFATSNGDKARAYAESRGLTRETLREFRFGFAPGARDGLKRHLVGKGVEERAMVEAGLVIKPDDGRPGYDRFRNRLIIPIHDARGRVVAFGGRTLDPDGQPKYLNSPETPLFHKGHMLFNVHRAREAAFKSGKAIVVEGYMDAIAIFQAGLPFVVASLGTAFTEEQIAQMWRLANEPVVCFDGDAAGDAASNRSVDRIIPSLKSGYSFQFVRLPGGQDPDDLIRSGGAAAFQAELNKARPLIDVLWEREISLAPYDTPERKAALEKRIDDLVGLIRDERVRKRYQLEARLRLSNLFFAQSRSARRGEGRGSGKGGANGRRDWREQEEGAWKGGARSAGEGPMFSTERTLCGLCLKYPELFDRHLERVAAVSLAHDLHARFRDELCRIATELAHTQVSDFFDKLDVRFYQILSEALGSAAEGARNGGGARPRDQFLDLFQRVPVLRHNPPDDFIETMFVHFLDVLETRSLEQELGREMAVLGDNLNEEAWARMQALSQDLARRREECARDEQNLADQGKKIRDLPSASVGR